MAKIYWQTGKVADQIFLPIVFLSMVLYFIIPKVPAQSQEDLLTENGLTGQSEEDILQQDELFEAALLSIVENNPGTEYSFQAQRQLALQYIKTGKDDEAQEICNNLAVEFPQHPEAHLALICAADGWHKQDKYTKAMGLYQKVVGLWPDKEYTWHAQFMIGRSYEKMIQAGLISQNVVKYVMSDVYKKLILEYPDCPASQAAINWLQRNIVEEEELEIIKQYLIK